MNHGTAHAAIGRGTAITPSRQKLDRFVVNARARSLVKEAMRRRQYKIGRDQRARAESRAANVETANRLPWVRIISRLKFAKRTILRNGTTGRQQNYTN
jgi:hypothetical protein